MKFEKLMEKKKKEAKEMSPMEKKAKMGVLEDMRSQAGEMMADRLHGLKKVSVSSDSQEGLKSGLEKAEEIVDGGMPKMESEESEKEDDSATEEHFPDANLDASEGSIFDDMDESELDKHLAELMALKKKKEQEKV